MPISLLTDVMDYAKVRYLSIFKYLIRSLVLLKISLNIFKCGCKTKIIDFISVFNCIFHFRLVEIVI